MRSHLTIFHNVVNITLNRHHGVLCQLQINQIYPEVQQLLQIYRWLAAFRNIAVLSLSSILYLAVSLLCWALPYMTHFRRLARTELDDLSLAESEDLEKDEQNTKTLHNTVLCFIGYSKKRFMYWLSSAPVFPFQEEEKCFFKASREPKM